ncbi:MAG: PIG-L family deacetylase [Actinomycetota bacterium]|jgi:LmbE family N-acetylglucosaminyl deacetylase|nr:PIG-L family deacetylase [Actinomycetota bacterium]
MGAGRVVAPTRHALLRRVARSAPRPPERLLPAMLEIAASLSSSGPSLLPPAARRVLVLVPHPDDEAIGAGGLMALLAARGARVDALLATDGEATIGSALPPEEIARRRRAEFTASVALLGAHVAATLGLADGALAQHRDELVEHVHAAIGRARPDLVLAPWPLDGHPDHRAVAEVAAEALLLDGWSSGGGASPALWTYEVHTPIHAPTHIVDVTDHLEQKRAALEVHLTAAGAFDLTACLGLARWRSLATRAGRGAAEAYLEIDPATLLRLSGEVAP